MVDGICDREIGLAFEMEGWGNSGCRGRVPPFLKELLVPDVINEVLSVADEQWGHVDEVRDREGDGSNGVCNTAVFARD